MPTYKVLLVGLDGELASKVKESCKDGEFTIVENQADFENAFFDWQDGQFAIIFASHNISGISALELAQTINSQCPSTAKYFLAKDLQNFAPKNLLKNGFSGVYRFPQDTKLLEKAISNRLAMLDPNARLYSQVKVIDLDPQSSLDFDTFVYLPLNKKHVKVSQKNAPIGDDKFRKLQDKHNGNILIDSKSMSDFQRYTAERLAKLGGVSSTEAQSKLQSAVKEIITDIFDQTSGGDFETGKKVIENCQKMISNFVTRGKSGSWYDKLISSLGESDDVYNHAGNVSTFAALFAVAVGLPPDDLAIAGLFHDIGLSELPAELSEKDPSALQPEEIESYSKHIDLGLNALKNKKIIISPVVEKAILQHHEAFSGRGFPKKLSGDRISKEAQILSFADQFDRLIRIEAGRPRLTPEEAFEKIKATGSISPEICRLISGALTRQAPKAS